MFFLFFWFSVKISGKQTNDFKTFYKFKTFGKNEKNLGY